MVCKGVQGWAYAPDIGRPWSLKLVVGVVSRNLLKGNDLRGWDIDSLKLSCKWLEDSVDCE